MKPKHPGHAAHRRGLLKSLLSQGIDAPSHTALSAMMHGYKTQGSKPSTGTRPAPRAHLVRAGSSGIGLSGLEHSFDRMVASALTGGSQTTGVLSSMFGLSPNLTG